VGGRPFQARELGANDDRFSPKQYADPAKLANAARVFGGITARAHLLSSVGDEGPRPLAKAAFSRRLIAFALEYADQAQRDHAEFCSRRDEIAKVWL
jgi:Uncharacterized protein conserved in bacteria (DUF2252)